MRTATATELDAGANLMGAAALAPGETDEELRARVLRLVSVAPQRAQAFVRWKDGESSEVAALRTSPGVYSVHLPSSRTGWEIAHLSVSVLDSGEDIERCELHFDAKPTAAELGEAVHRQIAAAMQLPPKFYPMDHATLGENLFARTVREQLQKAAAAGLVEPQRCECGSGVHKPGPGHSSYCALKRPA